MRAELDGAEGPAPEEEASCRASIVPEVDEAGGLSLATLGRLQTKIDAANDEKAKRAEALCKMREQMEVLRATLGYPAEKMDAADAAVSRATLAAAEAKVVEYRTEVERRQQVLSDCNDYIHELRVKLEIPQAEWVVLPLPENAGLSQDVLEKYNGEILSLIHI